MWLIAIAALLQAAPAPVLIEQGARSGINEARQVVVRTGDEWAALWRAHAATRPQPQIDFGRETIVGVFLGSRPTAGYRVELVGVRDDRGVLNVRYREVPPPSDAVTAQVLTSPYALWVVAARPAEVRFEKVP